MYWEANIKRATWTVSDSLTCVCGACNCGRSIGWGVIKVWRFGWIGWFPNWMPAGTVEGWIWRFPATVAAGTVADEGCTWFVFISASSLDNLPTWSISATNWVLTDDDGSTCVLCLLLLGWERTLPLCWVVFFFRSRGVFSRNNLDCLELGMRGSVGRSFGRLFPTTSSGEKGLGGFLFLELLEMLTF